MAPTAALILAAGLGIRFGGRKLLALIDGRPMLQHVLDLCAQTALSPVVVVLGDDTEALVAACKWRAEIRVVNPRPRDGISGSVRLGLRVLEPGEAERVVVLLGDQPMLSEEQLLVVLDAAAKQARPITVPRYRGLPGNPVVLDRTAWPLAAALTGDRGMSQLFADHPEVVRHVDVPGDNPGIDTAADLDSISRA